MATEFQFCDDLGPNKIIQIYEPAINLRGVLVVDNTAIGPSIGGLRIAPDVSLEECARLARAMTLKNAMANIPHGGGKSVLFADPRMPTTEKEVLIRTFANALKDIKDYIFGPDMGSNETCMAWIKDEIGRSVGLPRELGGIPLDQVGATAWGLYHTALVAENYVDFSLHGAKLAVQGFGAVGKHAARFLSKSGVRLVAASDSSGTVYNSDGLDITGLIQHKENGNSVATFSGGKSADQDAILDIDCDIWIPAARPDVVTIDNVERLHCKLILQGANIPITLAAEKRLQQQNVLVIPDFVANAGGVICAAMEYQGATQASAFAAIEEKLSHNTEAVLTLSQKKNISPRDAANIIAIERLKNAMAYRRFSTFASA